MEMESKSNSDIHVGGVKDYSFEKQENKKNTFVRSESEDKQKKEFPNGRLALGIVLIVVSVFVGFQSLAALAVTDAIGATLGLTLSTTMFTCGIIAIVSRNIREPSVCRGIGIALSIVGIIAYFVKVEMFSDLKIWSFMVVLVGAFFAHCSFAIKSNNTKMK